MVFILLTTVAGLKSITPDRNSRLVSFHQMTRLKKLKKLVQFLGKFLENLGEKLVQFWACLGPLHTILRSRLSYTTAGSHCSPRLTNNLPRHGLAEVPISAYTSSTGLRLNSTTLGLVLGGPPDLLPTPLAVVLLPPQDSQGKYPDAPQK